MEEEIRELERKQLALQLKINELENRIKDNEGDISSIKDEMSKSILENKILLTNINAELKALNDKIIVNKESTNDLKKEVIGLNIKLINVFIYITLGSISTLCGIKITENIIKLFF